MNNTARSGDLMGAAAPGALARREQLSALADGELAGEELVQALQYAAQADGESTWQLYHLVGDVLRSPDLAKPAAPDFLARLRVELAKETPAARPDFRTQMNEVVAAPMADSANASVFRWKMVAGVASLAAVAAIGWTSLSALQGSGGATGGAAQLLVKSSRRRKHLLFDVPVLGPQTIEVMRETNTMAATMDAGRTLLLDREELIEKANRYGISLSGVAVDDSASN